MVIVWDEPKRLANIDKHGFDFADVLEFEWHTAAIVPARSSTGGQNRLKAIGRFRDGTLAVIFAMLGTEAVSIVSFRSASPKERQVFYEKTKIAD